MNAPRIASGIQPGTVGPAATTSLLDEEGSDLSASALEQALERLGLKIDNAQAAGVPVAA